MSPAFLGNKISGQEKIAKWKLLFGCFQCCSGKMERNKTRLFLYLFEPRFFANT
jgi:hypothetical protein